MWRNRQFGDGIVVLIDRFAITSRAFFINSTICIMRVIHKLNMIYLFVDRFVCRIGKCASYIIGVFFLMLVKG